MLSTGVVLFLGPVERPVHTPVADLQGCGLQENVSQCRFSVILMQLGKQFL